MLAGGLDTLGDETYAEHIRLAGREGSRREAHQNEHWRERRALYFFGGANASAWAARRCSMLPHTSSQSWKIDGSAMA